MKLARLFMGSLSAVMLGAAVMAQAPQGEIDAHVAPRQPGENHPFIVGADGVQRYFTVMAECALASKLRLGAK